MPQIKTLAVQISEETYPIAVACLAAGFATIPFRKVVDCFLVLNEREVKRFAKQGERPYLVISNCWMSAEHFHEKYHAPKFAGPDYSKFVEVEQI